MPKTSQRLATGGVAAAEARSPMLRRKFENMCDEISVIEHLLQSLLSTPSVS